MKAALITALIYGLAAALILGLGMVLVQWAGAFPLVAACDVDGNGTINSADLGLQARAFGTSGPGDVNLDGVVNSADLGLCARHFGERTFLDDGSWAQNDATIAAAIATQDAIATETATP